MEHQTLEEITLAWDALVESDDPILRQSAEHFETIDEDAIAIGNRLITLCTTLQGAGLAAPQIGVSKQVFAYKASATDYDVLYNPIVIQVSEEKAVAEEGCFSLPGITVEVERPTSIVVQGRKQDGQKVSLAANDYIARIFLHEIDHLHGKMISDEIAEEERDQTLKLVRKPTLEELTKTFEDNQSRQ